MVAAVESTLSLSSLQVAVGRAASLSCLPLSLEWRFKKHSFSLHSMEICMVKTRLSLLGHSKFTTALDALS